MKSGNREGVHAENRKAARENGNTDRRDLRYPRHLIRMIKARKKLRKMDLFPRDPQIAEREERNFGSTIRYLPPPPLPASLSASPYKIGSNAGKISSHPPAARLKGCPRLFLGYRRRRRRRRIPCPMFLTYDDVCTLLPPLPSTTFLFLLLVFSRRRRFLSVAQ